MPRSLGDGEAAKALDVPSDSWREACNERSLRQIDLNIRMVRQTPNRFSWTPCDLDVRCRNHVVTPGIFRLSPLRLDCVY